MELNIHLSLHPRTPTSVGNVLPVSEKFFLRGNNEKRFFPHLETCRGSLSRIRCNFSPMLESEVRDDVFYMRRCVDLARRAIGCTSPNPMVGCVIVKDREVVGEGFHPKAGQPHAEVFALRDAGELAENATAYVSLEPCNHYGRTPPCTEALIKAKVKRVVVGMVDPNPIVSSKGVEKLRSSGIDVTVGIEEALCKRLNEAYIHRMLSGRPFVTARYSLAINGGGIINHADPEAMESGGYYSRLLKEYDGVIVTSNSFNQKSALPTSAELGANQPTVIFIAPKGGLPLRFPASVDINRRMVVFIEDGATIDPDTDLKLSQLGVEMVTLSELGMTPILEYCSCQGMCSVLLEVDGEFPEFKEILHRAVEEGMVQKAVVELCNSQQSRQMAKEFCAPFHLKRIQSMANSRGNVVVEGYIS